MLIVIIITSLRQVLRALLASWFKRWGFIIALSLFARFTFQLWNLYSAKTQEFKLQLLPKFTQRYYVSVYYETFD